MPQPLVHRSERFARAAKTELDRLKRRQGQLAEKRAAQQRKIDELDQELEAVAAEIQRMAELADTGSDTVQLVPAPNSEARSVLRGSAIRAFAVPLLMRTRGGAPIHYREWFELLTREGYEVAGRRPDAVFLNQVARSPLVRATTKAGYYEIDLEAPQRLQVQLHEQQAQLIDFMRQIATNGSQEFQRDREQQREMNTAIARTERELKEVEGAIEAAPQGPGELRAA